MVSSLIPHAPGLSNCLQFSMIFRSPCLNQPHPPHIRPPFPLRGKSHVTILLLSRWKLLIRGLHGLPLYPLTWHIPPLPNPVCFPPQGGYFRMLAALSQLLLTCLTWTHWLGLRFNMTASERSSPKENLVLLLHTLWPFFPPIAFITTDGYIYFVVINSKTITLNGDSPLWSRWFKSKVYPQTLAQCLAHNKHFYTGAWYLQPHFFYE